MRRLRAFLSALGVLFGVAAVVTMLSIGEGAKRETLSQLEQLGMQNILVRSLDSCCEMIDPQLLFDSLPRCRAVAPIKVVGAAWGNEVLATTEAYAEVKGIDLAEGRFLCPHDCESKALSCVVGSEVAQSLGVHSGDTLSLFGQRYEVVGTLRSREWKQANVPALTSRNLNRCLFVPLGNDTVLSELIVKVDGSTERAADLVDRVLKDVDGIHIIVPRELLAQSQRALRTFNLVLGSIAAISLVVGGIGIMNIMLANVTERTAEIGLRRAIGATEGHILRQFLFETLVLTGIGALLGLLVGCALSFAINHFAGWQTHITLSSLLLSMAMALGVGLASGYYPARRAARLDPITALRFQ